MLKNRIFATLFAVVILTAFFAGQLFTAPQILIAHAQAGTPISFDNMTQLSPDGQKVVYVTAQNLGMVGTTIWMANADLSQPTALVAGDSTGNAYWVTNPVWSPDGQQIAYVKVVVETTTNSFNYRYEIWAIASNGSNNRLLNNTLFHPSVGYGGKTDDLIWTVNSQVEFSDLSTYPITRYALNPQTLATSILTNGDQSGSIPYQADIQDVTQYLQATSPWGEKYINDDSENCATLAQKGSALTSAAMTLNYLFPAPLDPINPGDVNTAMHDNGFQSSCWIIWPNISTPYTTAKIDPSSLKRSSNVSEYTWRQQIYPKMQAKVAAGVPVILWYYLSTTQNDYAPMNFVTVIGYNGSDVYVYDPKVDGITTIHFFDTGMTSIQGLLVIDRGLSFSKVSPVKDTENIDPQNVTLSWDALVPTPKSYRYCVHPEGEMSCGDPNNHDFTNVGLNTNVTLQLAGQTNYTWQVQAIIEDTTIPKKFVNANFVKAWTFKTGDAPTITISGSVGSLQGVEMDYGGTVPVYTNTVGYYEIHNLPSNWHGRVTPIKAGITFDLPYRDYNNPGSDQTSQDYTPQVIISGKAGAPNVILDYIDVTPKSAVADGYGNYSFPVTYGWSNYVTPRSTNMSFKSVAPPYDVKIWYDQITQDQVNQNYKAFVTISGYISPLAFTKPTPTTFRCTKITYTGATVNDATNFVTTGTGSDCRYYQFTVPYGWRGTVKPSYDTGLDFTYSPAQMDYLASTGVVENQKNQNYGVLVRVDGYISRNDTHEYAKDAVLTYSNIASPNNTATPGTDSAYRYYKLFVPFGWTGSVTPSKQGFVFSPVSYVVTTSVTSPLTLPDFMIGQTIAIKSIEADDGWILESPTIFNTANPGGILNSAGLVVQIGNDANQRQQRAILSFDTSGLPDNAIVQSAVLKLKKNQIVGLNPFTTFGALHVDIRKGIFGAASTMELIDFDAGASATSVVNFDSVPNADWYSATLPATGGLSNINLLGKTQFRLRFDTHTVSAVASMYFYSGNYHTDAYEPVLTVTYFLP